MKQRKFSLFLVHAACVYRIEQIRSLTIQARGSGNDDESENCSDGCVTARFFRGSICGVSR